jgi:hypothetical protein
LQVTAFEFAAQAEDHPDEVRSIGVLGREAFEFGDKVAKDAGFGSGSKLHGVPPDFLVPTGDYVTGVASVRVAVG